VHESSSGTSKAAPAYRRRASVLEDEREYRVEQDHLVVGSGGAERRLPWAGVRWLRLTFAPTEQKRGRYVFVLAFASRERIQIDNMHWRGFADFEDRSGSYVPFVRASVERIRALAPGARAFAGAPWWSYLGQIAILSISGALLVWVLLEVSGHVSDSNQARVAAIVAALPVVMVWLVRGRPRRLDLGNLPPSVLPPESPQD
jgi:hypothetical protein